MRLGIRKSLQSSKRRADGRQFADYMPWAFRLRLCLVALLGLSGHACTSGPDYVRPEASIPAAYKEARIETGELVWRTATPADTQDRGAWWEFLGDPTLNRLEAQLLPGNFDVQAATARWREAQAQSRQAHADLFPTLSVDLSQDRVGGAQTSSRTALSLSARWEADLWGGQRRQWEAAGASAEAQAAELAAVRLAAQAGLAQDYIALRVAEAQRVLLKSQAAQYKKALQLTRNRHRAGVAAGTDTVAAEAQWRGAEARAIDRQAQLARLEHAIAVRLGQTPAALDLAPGPLALRLPVIPLELPSRLLERRPDIAAAERRMAAANARIGLAAAAGYPALRLEAGLDRQAQGLASLLNAPTSAWSLGATLVQTLFDAGQIEAQTDAARAAFDAAVADYRALVLGAFQEVEDQLSNLRLLAAQAEVQQQALAASRRAAELTLNQYKAGTVSFLDVTTVQVRALAAELEAIDLRGQRLTAAVTLIKALGGGWAPP